MIGDSTLDDMIAKFAVGEGLILPADVDKARQTRQTSPRPLTLAGILRDQGLLTQEQLDQMTRKIRTESGASSAPTVQLSPAGFKEQIQEALSDPKRRVGKYVLLGELGRGGMGIVRKAWDTLLERHVAIKCLPASADAEDLARFRREAQTAAKLNHPNIVPVHEILEHEGTVFVVMELIDGARLDADPHDFRKIAEVIRDAARAIQFAHEKGIIHRDLKPANMILDLSGRIWVMDFGLARPLTKGTTLTQTGIIQGTPSYMSPEHATGSVCTPLSDVYSLGATLYDLLTGELPFKGDNPLDVLAQIVNEDPDPPRKIKGSIPADLETITLKCMEKKPERRYRSAGELALDLDRWLKGDPILAHPPSTFYRLMKFVQRRRAWTAAAVLVLLIGAYAASSVASRRNRVRLLIAQAGRSESAGRVEAARDAYKSALDLDSHDAEAGAGVERMEAALRAREDRLRADADAAKAKLKAREEASALLESARIGIDQAAQRRRDVGDYREVVAIVTRNQELIERAIERAPDVAAGHHLLGRAWSLRGEDDRSEACWRKAVELDPHYAAPHLELGRLLMFRTFDASLTGSPEETHRRSPAETDRRFAEAAREFAAFSALAGSSVQPLTLDLARAMEAQAHREASKVRVLFEAALKRYGSAEGMEEFHWLQGMSLADSSAARDAFSRALSLRPNYFEALFCRGNEHHQLQAYEEAAADFSRAIAIKPTYAPAWMARGLALRKMGDLDKAAADFERAAALDPTDAFVVLNRGVIHLDLQEYDKALAIFSEVIRREPKWAMGYELRGTAHGLQGDPQGAIADYSKSIELHPTVRAYTNRAGSYLELDRTDEALKDFKAGLDLAPEGDPDREYCRKKIEEYSRTRSY